MNKLITIFVLGSGSAAFFWMRSDVGFYFINNRQGSFLDDNFEIVHNTLLFFPVALLCAVVAALCPKEAFSYWSSFARVVGPLVIIGSFFINLGWHHTGGGFMNIDNDIDVFVILLAYLFFITGSIIQIIRGALSHRSNVR